MFTERRRTVAALMLFVLAVVVAGAQLENKPASTGATASQSQAGGALRPAGMSPSIGSQAAQADTAKPTANGIVVGRSYKNDASLPLRDIPPVPWKPGSVR